MNDNAQKGPGTPILSIRDLEVTIAEEPETRPILKGLQLDIPKGQTVALLGESGSGKTLAAYSVLGLLPAVASIAKGEILFQGKDLRRMSEGQLRTIRGNKIGMVYQEPSKSLNPLMAVGKQIGETLRLHKNLGRRAAREQVLSLMELVGIPDPRRRYRNLPHQLSGGVKQRVVIAMALACRPELILADEPTSALDTTVQAQIIDLLSRLIHDLRMSVFLISHDMGVVAALADRVAVLKGGIVVEDGPVKEVLKNPAHPYTAALLSGAVHSAKTHVATSVAQIEPTDAACPFARDCKWVTHICRMQTPKPILLAGTLPEQQRLVRCFLHMPKPTTTAKKS
ncbi:MAG: ABC transporter ATP-binding protein [Deltaproteobacteria bacterium]|nr:ABC transporter ATP-binding protein [Deltaproteobacteria bacterium]MBN2670813.1 ABC transporter ATP-binding protein [Deltaproteobacteria bacterium]